MPIGRPVGAGPWGVLIVPGMTNDPEAILKAVAGRKTPTYYKLHDCSLIVKHYAV